jgi:hypothetical protein
MPFTMMAAATTATARSSTARRRSSLVLYEYTTIDYVDATEHGFNRIEWRCPLSSCHNRQPFPLYDQKRVTDRVADHLADHYHYDGVLVRVYDGKDDTRLWPLVERSSDSDKRGSSWL